ncbi:LysR family transcriptional regulator [Vibrio agarivorans]|uniref:LysR family transcriptional regulator n=1 Tax=Vibrio agarivorans TaxID=153622 RepID=A0ABT7Y6D7_9VIBR|nr:LysR family transcriptional regulator [Vibrio agarivorans]MDN2483606.1 LysR family transcriptional regulator [Vibrio agarivorans]
MRNLNDIFIFCQVVEHGSMKKASEELEIPLSTVSRRILALEEMIGAQLFVRSKTKLTPTSDAKRYYERLSGHYRNLTEELDNINRDAEDVVGKVTIDCTSFVYSFFLKETITKLLIKHPKLKIKMISAYDTSTLDPDADIGILVGDLQDSSLVAKKVFDFRIKVVVSKHYAQEHGIVTSLSELKRHNFIGHLTNNALSGYNTVTKEIESVTLYPKITHHDTDSLLDMTDSGLGFCFTSEYFVVDAINRGDLVEWLPNFRFDSRSVYMAYRHRTLKSNAQQVVMDAILEAFSPYTNIEERLR